MKRVNIRRITRTSQKDIEIVKEIIFDYTHFLFKHKSSFKDFRVISDKNLTQIFYYETKIFNWLPLSPIVRFISVKKLHPEENMFSQVYINLKNKEITYFKCHLEEENNYIKIINDFSIPLNGIFYLLRSILVPIINLKMEVMWKEDKEMLNLRDKENEKDSVQCFAPTFNLEKIKEYNFKKYLDNNFIPDFLFDKKK